MRSLAIDVLGVFGLPPVAFVNLAADLGCDGLSVTTFFGAYNPHGYPSHSLATDKALPRDAPVSLEIPQRSLADAGVGPYERLGPCVEAGRALLAEVG
jgi:hypothetical protein